MVACVEPEVAPGVFEAGFGAARIEAPVGIGTAGFGPFGAGPSDAPFSQLFPSTRGIHGHPGFRAAAMRDAEGDLVVLLRVDAVGVFAQLRHDIADRAGEALGMDLSDALVIGATHTHSGPGRVLNAGGTEGSVFDVLVDTFHPGFYERYTGAAVEAVVQAVEDLAPARLAQTTASNGDCHADRRCEDGESHTNDDLALMAIERDGRIEGLIMTYAIHGTALGIDQLLLSQDVSGHIEQSVQDAFDHPTHVLLFNAWAADMSPSHPEVPTVPAAAFHGQHLRMQALGASMADTVGEVLPGLAFQDDPDVFVQLHHALIGRDEIGYDEGEFPYDHGATFCGSSSGSCESPAVVDGLDRMCALTFREDAPAPDRFTYSVGVIGEQALVTFPGEPGTRLVEGMLDQLGGEVFFVGYGQDYLGYSLSEDDWWMGGYEASGALWGPGQGDYIAARILEGFERSDLARQGELTRDEARAGEPERLEPFPLPSFDPYQPAPAVGVGEAEVAPVAVAVDEVLSWTVQGADPWLGTPRLEVLEGDETVLRPSGLPLDAEGYQVQVTLAVDPPWSEEADARRFLWTFGVVPRPSAGPGVDLSGRTVRLRVTLPVDGGEPVVVTSDPIEVLVEPIDSGAE